jgi:tetratricopeptide (TPR) repeat protein
MPDVHNLLAQARAAAAAHRFDEAASLGQRILSGAPTCLVAMRILAWAQLELGDDRALATFQRCAALDPEDALAEVGQAIWYQQREQQAPALERWVRAWELDPFNQEIRRGLVRLAGELPESVLADGIGLLRAGRYDEAAEVLWRVADTSRPAARLALMTALWAQGAARQVYSLAIAVHAAAPESIKALLYVAASEEAEGRTLRGRDFLARAEQADPGLELFGEVARDLHLHLLSTPDTARASRPTLASAW